MTQAFTKAIKNVDKFKRQVKDDTEEALEEAIDDINRRLKWQLRAQKSVATGTLLDSLDTYSAVPQHKGEYARQQIRGADHWKYLEYGTGRGSPYKAASPGPPFLPIYRWVVAKGITPDRSKGLRTQADVAYAIQNSLSTGTHSNPFVRPVWRSARGKQHVVDKVGDAFERALHRSF